MRQSDVQTYTEDRRHTDRSGETRRSTADQLSKTDKQTDRLYEAEKKLTRTDGDE